MLRTSTPVPWQQFLPSWLGVAFPWSVYLAAVLPELPFGQLRDCILSACRVQVETLEPRDLAAARIKHLLQLAS